MPTFPLLFRLAALGGPALEAFPIHLVILTVLLNRYVLGAFLKRIRGPYVDPVQPGLEPSAVVKEFGELTADTLSLAEIAANRSAASEMVDRVGLNDGPAS